MEGDRLGPFTSGGQGTNYACSIYDGNVGYVLGCKFQTVVLDLEFGRLGGGGELGIYCDSEVPNQKGERPGAEEPQEVQISDFRCM